MTLQICIFLHFYVLPSEIYPFTFISLHYRLYGQYQICLRHEEIVIYTQVGKKLRAHNFEMLQLFMLLYIGFRNLPLHFVLLFFGQSMDRISHSLEIK